MSKSLALDDTSTETFYFLEVFAFVVAVAVVAVGKDGSNGGNAEVDTVLSK